MSLDGRFIEMLRTLGPAYDGLEETIEHTEPSVAVRVNRIKWPDAHPSNAPVEWCADGFYLPERPQFTLDPRLHQGLYYPQDASSMAVAAAVKTAVDIVDSEQPLRYLDACAAPGGKTTAAISALPRGSLVVANEYDPRRAAILTENIAKWGHPGVIVTQGDASQISGLDGFYDIIAADVPCSGEGMMRKDLTAREQWSPALVTECATRQEAITDALWQALRPGGCLIYSTCTFNTRENEDIINRLAELYGAEGVEINTLNRPEIARESTGNLPAYRFIPGHVRGEGQFVALLRKPGDAPATRLKPSKPSKTPAPLPCLSGEYRWHQTSDGTISAFPTQHASALEAVSRRCRVISAGVECGIMKGRDFIPSQALALSTAYVRDSYPEAEIDIDTALAYLRREAISVPEAPRGIVLLKHGDHPLGWIKNLGNRANNLYPQHWRIRNL